jgi:hypothetical protein
LLCLTFSETVGFLNIDYGYREEVISIASNARPSETTTLRIIEDVLAEQLPSAWTVRLVRAPGRPSGRRRDVTLRVEPWDGVARDLAVVVKAVLTPLAAAQLVETLDDPAVSVVVAPYLGERTRAVLADRGVSSIDTTGNVWLQVVDPPVFVSAHGADRDPWPDTQPLKTLRGRSAGRAVRALVDFRPPFGVRELAGRADLSPATLARVIELLEREALLTRDARGRVTEVDWAGCIRRWSEDHTFTKSNVVTELVAPRGLDDVIAKLKKAKWPYAVTGSIAAQPRSTIAPVRQAMIYTEHVDIAMRFLDVRETDLGANLLIAEPFEPVVFDRTDTIDGLTLVAPSQAACDLLTGTGRMPSEGEELLDWMRLNERTWHR